MSQPLLGEIRAFPYDFVPAGWAECNGQLLSVTQNAGLFAVLGVTYGGDGEETFGLPDLRGRVAIGSGQGPGLSQRALGESGGEAAHELQVAETPLHTHSLRASSAAATLRRPGTDRVLAAGDGLYGHSASADATLDASTVTTAGGGEPHNNLMPSLALRFCISLTGVFPVREGSDV